MSWESDAYRGSPRQLSPGSNETWYGECNWGAARMGGYGDGSTGSTIQRFNRNTRRIEAGSNVFGYAELGAQSQAGYLFEIDGFSDYSGLEITYDLGYWGLLEVNGMATCNINYEIAVIEDSAEKWPAENSEHIVSQKTLLEKSLGNNVRTDAWHDSVSGNPLYISNPSYGDQYRIALGMNASASSTLSSGAARSDGESKANDAYDGGGVLSLIEFNWV